MSEELPPNERGRNIALPEDSNERVGMLRNLLDQSILSWRLLWDGRVDFLTKLIPIGTVAYIFSPLDILPELLFPVLGPGVILDDIGIIILGLTLFSKAAPPDIVAEHLREIRRQFTNAGDEPDDDVIDVEAEPLD